MTINILYNSAKPGNKEILTEYPHIASSGTSRMASSKQPALTLKPIHVDYGSEEDLLSQVLHNMKEICMAFINNSLDGAHKLRSPIFKLNDHFKILTQQSLRKQVMDICSIEERQLLMWPDMGGKMDAIGEVINLYYITSRLGQKIQKFIFKSSPWILCILHQK